MNQKLDQLLELLMTQGEMGVEINDLVLKYNEKRIHIQGNIDLKIEE